MIEDWELVLNLMRQVMKEISEKIFYGKNFQINKDLLMVMVFDENLLVDLMFEHVDKVYNEEMNLMIMDQFLHVKELSRSE
jgi:hypothetical protein